MVDLESDGVGGLRWLRHWVLDPFLRLGPFGLLGTNWGLWVPMRMASFDGLCTRGGCELLCRVLTQSTDSLMIK